MEEKKITADQIALKKQEEMKSDKARKDAEAKKNAEPKGAAAESSTEKVKTEEKAREALEAQTKEDEKILSIPEDKLDEKGKQRKAELVEIKKKKDEEEHNKPSNIHKRIDELVGTIKALKAEKTQDKEAMGKLEKELTDLRKKTQPPDKKEAEELKGVEQTRIKKYIEEDKALPREERREMTDEEIDDWLADNYSKATQWITERTIRRISERDNDKRGRFVKKILDKQNEVAEEVSKRHPELNTEARQKELKAEGKSTEEIRKIIFEENPKVRICSELLSKNSEKYLTSEDGPELLASDMEKELAKNKDEKPKKKTVTLTEEELDEIKKKAAEEEAERIANADAGFHSTRDGEPAKGGKKMSELEIKRDEILAKAKMPKERYDELKERRKHIKGANIQSEVSVGEEK